MIAHNAYNQYKENSINTATPEELTLMLYNGLIKFIMRGIDSVEKNNVQEAHNNITRAQDIIKEFMSTLDLRYEVSKNLYAIYDYLLNRLMDANLKKDKGILEEVLDFAKTLRDTWEQAMKTARHQVAKSQVASV